MQHLNLISDFVKITPEMARTYLEQNIDLNRTIRWPVVEQMVRDMKNNKWRKTHQGIAFDVFGRLVDGQHRMIAIIKAGVPVEMMVTRNLIPEDFFVIDTGTRRVLADNLKANGVTNQNTVGALTLKMIAHQKGITSVLDTRDKDGKFGRTSFRGSSREEQIEFFNKNRDVIILCAEFGRSVYGASRNKLVTAPNIALLYWVNGMTPEFAEFIRSVVLGINIKENTTAYHLRRILEDMAAGKRIVSSAQIAKAWAVAYAKKDNVCKKFVF